MAENKINKCDVVNAVMFSLGGPSRKLKHDAGELFDKLTKKKNYADESDLVYEICEILSAK